MAEDVHTTTDNSGTPHTTVIERRGSGAGILIGLAVLIAVVVGAFFLINQTSNQNAETQAITGAAESVGDAADSVSDAVKGE
jgi:CHASE3 domain sensor protein